MPIVALVRHGQASFGAADYDELSPLGRRQAQVVGEELARRGLREPLLARGTLRRQRDTLSALAGAAAFPGEPAVDARWDEYDHEALLLRYGGPERAAAVRGDSRAFQALLDVALAAWDADGGWAGFADGAAAALAELADRLPRGRDAVVVTSGGVLGALAAHLVGAGAATAVAFNRVAVNAAVTTVIVGSRGASLLTFNDHAFLDGELRTYR
ncbi:histidine phosphatase family protein [Pseudonocardia sp.]|uniref:histidine phosphatase family protein n=1 Tax=Pseudonocardia sp. TaxID=60912 RepID=UPI003D122CE6